MGSALISNAPNEIEATGKNLDGSEKGDKSLNQKTMKRISSLIFLMSLSKISFTQNDFSNFSICHNKSQMLSCVADDVYLIIFSRAQFMGFRTTDNILQYDETSRTFSIKNVKGDKTKDSIIHLQLTGDGPVLKNSDSSIALSKLESLNNVKSESEIINYFNFSMYLGYSGSVLFKMVFDVGLTKIIVNVFEFKGEYYWDITGLTNTTSFTLDYTFSRINSISLWNEAKRNGVNLFKKNGKGVFNRLEMYDIDSRGYKNTRNQIFYKQTGQADANKGSSRIDECNCGNAGK